jgi:hypothetical protein
MLTPQARSKDLGVADEVLCHVVHDPTLALTNSCSGVHSRAKEYEDFTHMHRYDVDIIFI